MVEIPTTPKAGPSRAQRLNQALFHTIIEFVITHPCRVFFAKRQLTSVKIREIAE